MTYLEPQISLQKRGSAYSLCLSGDWIARQSGLRSKAESREWVKKVGTTPLRIDVLDVGHWDSALVVFIRDLKEACEETSGFATSIILEDLPESIQRLLSLAGGVKALDAFSPNKQLPSLAARVGLQVIDMWSETTRVMELVGNTILRCLACFGGKAHVRSVDIMHELQESGVKALGIVSIVNLLVGAILAFVGAVQLQRFGAGIYVADLVGLSVVREMAAVMTGIVMAGRTGGAYAAHIATMQGNEEIDALKALGIPVYDFLILPRVMALVTMMPLLYLYACAVGLFGGFIVSVATLDLTPAAFMNELQGALAGKQFFIGLTKSIFFGALIALVGCHIGLKAGRSAADVGRAATSAVVAGIVGIIALDAIFAVCLNALGI